tara:strand:- start:891 stop:1550 length:660 start_codon:yes stop_codon:yes gene_type:complete
MGKLINLLDKYPKTKRNTENRSLHKTEHHRNIARKFGAEFFDGEREFGYGGFDYNPKFWTEVVKDFVNYWKLKPGDKVLDVGCAKGFMVYDLIKNFPQIECQGIDISDYAIKNSLEEVKDFLKVANANNLPFEDNSFDVVISINTIHNLDEINCKKALQEIERVSKKNSFITVDAYTNEIEKKKMFEWNLTAKTIMSDKEWINFFQKANYTGDYYWFIP